MYNRPLVLTDSGATLTASELPTTEILEILSGSAWCWNQAASLENIESGLLRLEVELVARAKGLLTGVEN